jgi:Flp pilus assembly protein TadG
MRFVLSRLLPTLRNFRAARRGNVAISFALAAIPMIGFVGAAIDYSQANSAKADLQTALDSTALMLAKEAAAGATGPQLQTDAVKYFAAMFNRPQAKNVQVTAAYSTNGGSSISVNASASLPINFLQLIGYNDLSIAGSSTTKWSSSRLRVALVLDNTGSMAAHGKMGALKTATESLLSNLQSAATTNDDVYVSIVPFVKDVNVDPANYAAAWIDWTDWTANNGTCSKGKNGGFGSSQGTTQSTCNGTWTPANHNTWNGCVVDRGRANGPDPANYDTNVVVPTPSIKATLFSAEQYSSCPQAATGLSYDWSAMNRLVNNMSPAGSTNQAIGLQLGWISLTGGGPFAAPPAMDPNYTYSQNIILLSDGLNTQDRWYGNGSSVGTTDDAKIDARQQMTCDNIKAAGITLYTIQVNTDSDPTSALLQHCASSSDKFFLLSSADQILPTFNSIGANLTKLYIAR